MPERSLNRNNTVAKWLISKEKLVGLVQKEEEAIFSHHLKPCWPLGIVCLCVCGREIFQPIDE